MPRGGYYDPPKIVAKTWGMEIHYVNDTFCGKRLIFAEDHRLSVHYHLKKREVFLIEVGTVLLELFRREDPDQSPLAGPPRLLASLVLKVGDTFLIEQGLAHRMTALGGNAVILEFSTTDDPLDSYRLESGQVWID
jgi:mannose-6-phosphate isomerase-like protein (cupin superfamily)